MKTAVYLMASLAAVIGMLYVAGMFLPQEHSAKRSIIIKAPIERVWNTVTDIENQMSWRHDLKESTILDKTASGLVWLEHPKKGRPITLREKSKTPYTRYEIEIVPGGSFSGYWVGTFSETDDGVRFESLEVGRIHNPVLRVLAYLFFDLGDTIKEYQNNLKNHLETNI